MNLYNCSNMLLKYFPFILQSFTNEDQLSIHKKKHDMMLNLGNSSKNGSFVGKLQWKLLFLNYISNIETNEQEM